MWRLRRHWMPMNGHGRSPAPRGEGFFCFFAFSLTGEAPKSSSVLPFGDSSSVLPFGQSTFPKGEGYEGFLLSAAPRPSPHVVAKSAPVRASAGRPRSAPLLLLSPADPLRWALPGPRKKVMVEKRQSPLKILHFCPPGGKKVGQKWDKSGTKVGQKWDKNGMNSTALCATLVA